MVDLSYTSQKYLTVTQWLESIYNNIGNSDFTSVNFLILSFIHTSPLSIN